MGSPAAIREAREIMGQLEGKVAIITGATSGIGARTGEIFVQEGAKVVLTGRREAEGKAVAATPCSSAPTQPWKMTGVA
jgi:NADP-dependent 3-hydroxy acid dehydrogenase YdfG